MQINHSNSSPVVNLYDSIRTGASLKAAAMPSSKASYDRLEISREGRQMAADAIELHPAHYIGTVEINDSLQRILEGQSPEIRNAAYTIIQSNLMPDGSVSDDAERSALLESGLSQAKYLADRYMTGEDSSKFMDVMNQIAAIAKTRTVDPVTGQASYTLPPQKPVGAPDDYINTGELMKRFEPKTYEKLQDALTNGGDWGKILVQFSAKVRQHPDWISKYKEETDQIVHNLQHTKIENRFAHVDTSGLEAFLQDMNNQFEQDSFSNTDVLARNLLHFARTLGYEA